MSEDSLIGKKFVKINYASAAVGLVGISAKYCVVDETERSVALKLLTEDDVSLSWVLKEDLPKCLREFPEYAEEAEAA